VQFGLVKVSIAIEALSVIQPEAVAKVKDKVRDELPIRPKDIAGKEIRLSADYIVENLSNLLQDKHRQLRRALWQLQRAGDGQWSPTQLKLTLQKEAFDETRQNLGLNKLAVSTFEDPLGVLDTQITRAMDWIATVVDQADQDGVLLRMGDEAALGELLLTSPADNLDQLALTKELVHGFQRILTLDSRSVVDWSGVNFNLYGGRLISIRRFLSWLDEGIRPKVQREIIARKPEHQAIGNCYSLYRQYGPLYPRRTGRTVQGSKHCRADGLNLNFGGRSGGRF
jgi:hypothetical protein